VVEERAGGELTNIIPLEHQGLADVEAWLTKVTGMFAGISVKRSVEIPPKVTVAD